MSYTIEYRQRAFIIKPEQYASIVADQVYGADIASISANGAPLYLFLTESGSNNTYCTITNKRARSVSYGLCGTHYDVIKAAIKGAEFIHSGSLKVHGKNFTHPEGYVAHIRKQLAEAVPIEVLANCVSYVGFLQSNLDLTALPRHPVFQQLLAAGEVQEGPKFYDLDTKVMKLGTDAEKIARLALAASYARSEYGVCMASTGHWVPGFSRLENALTTPLIGEQTLLAM